MGTGKENRNRLFSSGEKNFCNQQQNNKNQECYQLGRANQNQNQNQYSQNLIQQNQATFANNIIYQQPANGNNQNQN
jgi:hypothetical protein